MIPRSDQTMNLGLTSFASDQNSRPAPQYRFGAQMSQVMMPPEENVRLGGSLVTQPPYQNPRLNQIPRSDQIMNQQQRFSIPNRGLTTSAIMDYTKSKLCSWIGS